MHYTFFHLDIRENISSFELLYCESEAAARARMPEMFAERRRCQRVEVQDELGGMFTVERDGAGSRAAQALVEQARGSS